MISVRVFQSCSKLPIRIGLHSVLLELFVQPAITGRQKKNKEIKNSLSKLQSSLTTMDASAGEQTFYCLSQSLHWGPTMSFMHDLSINITLSYRIYNLVHSTDPSTVWPTPPLPHSWQADPSRVGIERSSIGPATGLLLHKALFVAMAFDTNKTLQFFQKLSIPKLNIFDATCS